MIGLSRNSYSGGHLERLPELSVGVSLLSCQALSIPAIPVRNKDRGLGSLSGAFSPNKRRQPLPLPLFPSSPLSPNPAPIPAFRGTAQFRPTATSGYLLKNAMCHRDLFSIAGRDVAGPLVYFSQPPTSSNSDCLSLLSTQQQQTTFNHKHNGPT